MRSVILCSGLAASWLAYAPCASAQQTVVRRNSGADTASADQPLRLYFSPIRVDSGYRLTPYAYSGATHVEQNVNFAERPDNVHVAPVIGVPVRAIDTWNGVQFVSPQLAGPLELSGLFRGRLDFIANKPRFDFQISLYELTSSGDYVLAATYSTQPGATSDTSHRTLLQPRIRQHLDYKTDHLTNRLIQNGSRLVVLITVLEKPDVRIKDATVSDASRGTGDDATEPLRISWYGESYIELHARHQ